MDLEAIWKRIADWHATNVPAEEFGLAPGATDEQITAFEEATGVILPEDVKASYRMHNGGAEGEFEAAGLVEYGPFLSLDGMLRQWKLYREMEASGDYDGDAPCDIVDGIDPAWMPKTRIHITDNSGDHLIIDTVSEKGTDGQVISHNHEVGPECVLAQSWTAFLSEIADGLEAGEYEYNEDEMVVCPVGMYD